MMPFTKPSSGARVRRRGNSAVARCGKAVGVSFDAPRRRKSKAEICQGPAPELSANRSPPRKASAFPVEVTIRRDSLHAIEVMAVHPCAKFCDRQSWMVGLGEPRIKQIGNGRPVHAVQTQKRIVLRK